MGSYRVLYNPASLLAVIKTASTVASGVGAAATAASALKGSGGPNPKKLARQEAEKAEAARKQARSLLAQQQGVDEAFTLRPAAGGPQPTRSLLGAR